MSSVDRRAELVEAALRVISAEGMGGATTRAIVAEAGMPLASFHYAFASRDDLMRELVEHVTSIEASAILDDFAPGRDIRSSVHGALTVYFATISADPPRELAMFELMQYALRTPELTHLATAQYAQYREAAKRLLIAGAEHARVEWTIPVDDLARIVITITDGLTFGWLADRDADGAARVIDFAADSLALLARPLPTTPTENP